MGCLYKYPKNNIFNLFLFCASHILIYQATPYQVPSCRTSANATASIMSTSSPTIIAGEFLLANFSFLETLNVSFNRLTGRVFTVFCRDAEFGLCPYILKQLHQWYMRLFWGMQVEITVSYLSLNEFAGEVPKWLLWDRARCLHKAKQQSWFSDHPST